MSLIGTKQGIRLLFLQQHQQACWNWSRLLSNVEEDAACGEWGWERSLFTGLYVQFSNIYIHITYSSFKFDAIFDTCNQSQRESTTSRFSLFKKKTKKRRDKKGFFLFLFFCLVASTGTRLDVEKPSSWFVFLLRSSPTRVEITDPRVHRWAFPLIFL